MLKQQLAAKEVKWLIIRLGGNSNNVIKARDDTKAT